MGTDLHAGNHGGNGRQLVELDRTEALQLLGTVSLGRVVFTQRALPAIRPVNHVIHDGDVIIRSHVGAAIVSAASDGVVVAYEADSIDPGQHLGWSVIVTGHARLVTDPDQLDRYRHLLRPWVHRPDMDHVVRIEPELVTGFTLVTTDPPRPDGAGSLG
jgi:nitroimidazol reductase NimA-like FMN-containing flavoprotein (pyridoxamine 5'-phosphate oxidase superfamily)